MEDENGNIVRETLKDNDVLVQYKIMRETLIYLALSPTSGTRSETQMLEKLHGVDSCKAAAMIHVAHAQHALLGERFQKVRCKRIKRTAVVTAIREAQLVRDHAMEDRKAVIASNIMSPEDSTSVFMIALEVS